MSATETITVSLPTHQLARRTRCERCSGAVARYWSPLGPLCCGCRGVLAGQATATRRRLAADYGVSEEQLLYTLMSDYGQIIVSASSGEGIPSLHYAPCWADAAREVLESEGQAGVNRQCRALGRVLWGVALRVGARLGDERPAYRPEEIPMEMVEWGVHARSHYLWLVGYGRELLRQRGREHASLSWLLDLLRKESAANPGLLPPVLNVLRDWPPVKNHPTAVRAA